MTRPLEGVVVVDLSTVGPASRCAAMLADLGAEVVKVVPPAGRPSPPAHAYHAGRGTRRIAVDLKADGGAEAVLALASDADVFLESLRPGVADRLGVGHEHVAAASPGIVYASVTGYGQDGPMADWAGHDLNYQAVAGLLGCQGRRPDGGPALPGGTVADSAGGGMHAALAVCAALVGRQRTGEGAYLDVAATDGSVELMSLLVDEHLATGSRPGPGSSMLTGRYACYDCYQAGDGRWLAVAAIEPSFFANLCRELGLERWIDHQLDDDVQDDIRADLAAAFARRDRDEWVERLGPADCCVSPVLTVDEVADHPQVRARAGTRSVRLDGGRRVRQLGPLLAGSGDDGPPPADSEADALLRRAGLSDERIEALQRREVVA